MDRRNEVLNEAVAREVERNVRTGEEIGHARRKVNSTRGFEGITDST